jgi:hypothetical protein
VEVFTDDDALRPGDGIKKEFTTVLSAARVVVVLLSRNTRTSQWVAREVVTALEAGEGRQIIPVLLDDEGKDNLVWPLIADRVAVIGSNPKSVRDAVLSLLEGRPAGMVVDSLQARRRFAWLSAGGLLIVVATLVLMFTGESPRSMPDSFGVQLAVLRESHRGEEPRVGDDLIITASATDLLLVYRDTKAVLRCPADHRCTRRSNEWRAELRLSEAGAYRIVYAAGVGEMVLTGSLDQDLIVLDKAALKLSAVPLVIR